jgi:hypothetical protein
MQLASLMEVGEALFQHLKKVKNGCLVSETRLSAVWPRMHVIFGWLQVSSPDINKTRAQIDLIFM